MSDIVSQEIIEENGYNYRVTTYDGGAILKELVVDDYVNEEIEEAPTTLPEISETESVILETAVNTEYLVALSELSM